MYFLPPDATVSQEEDLFAAMINFFGLANVQTNRIRVDGFDLIDNIKIEALEIQDTNDLAKTFSCLLTTPGISFVITGTNRIIRIMHWVQDHECVSLKASVVVLTTEPEMMDSYAKALGAQITAILQLSRQRLHTGRKRSWGGRGI